MPGLLGAQVLLRPSAAVRRSGKCAHLSGKKPGHTKLRRDQHCSSRDDARELRRQKSTAVGALQAIDRVSPVTLPY